MMKNWRTIAKIVVAVITALLGAVGATAAGGNYDEELEDDCEDRGGSNHRLVRRSRCNCRRRSNRVNASLVEEIVCNENGATLTSCTVCPFIRVNLVVSRFISLYGVQERSCCRAWAGLLPVRRLFGKP